MRTSHCTQRVSGVPHQSKIKTSSDIRTLQVCNALQYTATHCLQLTAIHCNSQAYVQSECATRCNSLKHTACAAMYRHATHTQIMTSSASPSLQRTAIMSHCKHCLQLSVMYCNTQTYVRCNTLLLQAYVATEALQCVAIHCNTLQHTATHCNILQHTATYYNTLRHTRA